MSSGPAGLGALRRLAGRRKPSVQVRPAAERVDRSALDGRLEALGADGALARRLDEAVGREIASIVSLSSLSAPLALDYIERLARPIPALTPEVGAVAVTRGYVAHLVVEVEPGSFGVTDIPILALPPLRRRGAPPRDLLTRAVKATRRNFDHVCALPPPVWQGFAACLTWRAHDAAGPDPGALVSGDVVDALGRLGWVLRQVDLRYGLAPERR